MFSAFTAGTKMRRYKSINSHPMRISTMSYEQLAMSYEQSAVSNNLKGKMQIVNKIIHKLSITICCLRYSLFPISYSLLPFAFCLLPFLVSAQSVISGKVFWDCNNNGVRDVGESGIKNITVRLLTTTNQQLSTLTDSVGNYSFNVSSGTYNVAVSMPIGSTKLNFSPRVVGADPTLNSDVDSSGMSDNLIVVSGTNYTSIDAGIVDQTAPKIKFINPLISGLFSGDTLTVTCDNLPRMDASWVTVSDNSKQNLTAVFTDNLLVEGNCQANGFSKLLNCTWSATDYCGNIGASYVLIKVIDTLAPVINNIPANVTVNTYLGDTVPNVPTNIYALDNCANNSVIPSIYNTVTAKTTCGSTITRTWSSTDGCGNTATKSQIIKVFDTQNCLVIYPNDTFKISLVASRSTDSCINGIFGTDRTVTSVSFTTPSISHNLVPSLINGCLKITALQSFNQPDTLTGTTCDSSGNSCRNFYLIITPQSLRLNSCNLFNQDTVAFIKLSTCSSKGYFCIPGVNDAIAFKNNYTISDNGAPYSGTLTGCQYDTTFSYTYITIPKLAKAGPYRLDYWLLNGQSYKIAAFRDIFVLVDSMNVWDKIGKWSVDTLTLTISGGKSVNTYGQIKITRLADGSVGYLEMNSELNANGVSVCFFAGTHEIIFKNNSTLCQDILRLVITCDTSVVSRKPHAINDNVSVKKNTLIIFDPTLNDSLFAAPIRTLTIINPPKNGSFAYSGNTSVVYVPTTGFCGNDTLKYAICNNYFLCDTANIFVSVSCATDSTPTQQKPIARADYTRSSKNVKVSIDFLSNDTPNGALTSTTIIKTPRRGVAVLNANKIDYTPNLNDCNYNDTLQYKICNAAGCDSTFVYVAVSCDTIPTGGSKKPVAVNDYITTTKNVTIRFKPTANDNINGILNSLSVFESPKHGSIGYIGLDSIIYKPNPDFCGRDTLRYQIGNTAFLSDSAYVFVNVTCGNDSTPTGKKPIAVNDNYNTPKSTALRFKPTANDIANGTIVSMGVTVQPKNGTVRALGIDSLMYTPNTNFCGLDSMKYNICNNFNLCDTAFIFINVACDTPPVPKKPIAVADNAKTKKNTLVSIDVLANDTQNGTLIVTSINKNPQKGTAVFNGSKIDYTPLKDSCNYSDTLQYKICNIVGCDSANVIIAVICDTPTISKKPIAITDNYTIPKNTGLRFKPTANDIANGTIVSMSLTVQPKNGGVRALGIDSLIYTPNTNFCGLDSMKYNICNNFNLCDTAFIYINVACDTPPVSKKPVALADKATVKKNILAIIDVLVNDTLNGVVTTTINKAPRRGSATINNNKIDYIPQKDSCSYSDTLQYKICNAVGCDSANVIVSVTCDTTPLPQNPIARTDNTTTKKNTLVTVDVLANDTQNGALTKFTIIKQPKLGTVVSNNYKFDYTPQRDSCNYSDTLQYKICNAAGCDSAFVFIKVNCDSTPPAKKPIAVNDNVTTNKNVTLRFRPTANDNINGTLASVSMVAGFEPKNGDVKYIGLDSLMYTPKKDFCGRDTFRYMVCNTGNLCDSAYVFVNVLCDSTKKPVAIADRATTKKNVLVTIDVQANDTLNGVATTTINKAPRRGTVVVNNNKIDYTPQKDSCNYSDTLQYKICNAIGCDSTNVIVSVTCPPDSTKKPVAVNDNAKTNKNKTVSIDILANDTPNGVLTVTNITRDPKKGKLVFNLTKIDYTPTKDSCGYIDTFQYKICNIIGCDTAFVFVSVSCDAPKTPKAVTDNATTSRNKTVIINVLANDTINGDLTTPVVITKNPKFGTINIVANAVVYTPSSGYCGVRDLFQYKICNAQGCDSTYSYVNITCDSTNLQPVANPDSVSTRKNTPIRIIILANDQINGTLDSIKITKSPILGTATLGTDNVLTYTPDSCGFIDSLRYRICNKTGCSETVVKINVICDPGVYKTPKATPDKATTYLNTPVTVDVTANDSLYGAPIDSVKVTTKPNHGRAIVANNKIIYTPDSCGYTDTLRYAVFTKGGSDTASLILNVICKRPDSLPPVAVYDVARGNKNTTLIIDVTANDTLRGADTFAVTAIPKNGTAQFDSLHRIKYVPNNNFCGRDTLIYQIANTKGSDTAIVFITIDCGKISRDSIPIANRDSATTLVNQPVTISVTANDSLRGATKVILIDTTTGVHGMPVVNADGKTITYTPFRNFFGVDTFRYVICNSYGCDTTTVYILINAGDSIIVYNGFSPNGDGMNDTFVIQGIDSYSDNEVYIFNRWGNEVYHTKGYSNSKGWDGKWNNVNVPDNTYFYFITINDATKGTIKKTGYVQIKR